MDDIFIRELVIFLLVLVAFVGLVPTLIRGNFADRIEDAAEAAAVSDGTATATRGLNKRRKARQRDATKKNDA